MREIETGRREMREEEIDMKREMKRREERQIDEKREEGSTNI